MNNHVALERAEDLELPVADVTGERKYVRVHDLMFAHVFLSPEEFAALVTRERFLAGMRLHVRLQRGSFVKDFPANLTRQLQFGLFGGFGR